MNPQEYVAQLLAAARHHGASAMQVSVGDFNLYLSHLTGTNAAKQLPLNATTAIRLEATPALSSGCYRAVVFGRLPCIGGPALGQEEPQAETVTPAARKRAAS